VLRRAGLAFMNEIYRKALALLAARDHTAAELAKKLAERFGEDPLPTIDALRRQGALNDRRFAENFVERRSTASPSRLRLELARRGVDTAVIDAVLAGASQDRPSLRVVLEDTMNRRKLKPPLSLRDAARIARALGRLGYPEDDIREELERLHEQ
jgi:SOS response regulatory protein OraA/RecX